MSDMGGDKNTFRKKGPPPTQYVGAVDLGNGATASTAAYDGNLENRQMSFGVGDDVNVAQRAADKAFVDNSVLQRDRAKSAQQAANVNQGRKSTIIADPTQFIGSSTGTTPGKTTLGA